MTEPAASAGALHYELIRGLVDDGVRPSRDATRLRCSSDGLDRAFEALAVEELGLTHPVWILPEQEGRF